MRSISNALCALLPFTATALGAAIEKRQGANIVYGLQQVQAQIGVLNQMLYYFDGNPATGALDAIKIQDQTDNVGEAVEYTTQIANASPTLDEADSLAVSTQVLSLRPDIKNLLLNIAAKKPEFDGVIVGLFSVSKQVKESLQDQKALTVALGDAIAMKLTGAFKKAAPEINDEFAMEFDAAIAAYVNDEGIPVPSDLTDLLE